MQKKYGIKLGRINRYNIMASINNTKSMNTVTKHIGKFSIIVFVEFSRCIKSSTWNTDGREVNVILHTWVLYLYELNTFYLFHTVLIKNHLTCCTYEKLTMRATRSSTWTCYPIPNHLFEACGHYIKNVANRNQNTYTSRKW